MTPRPSTTHCSASSARSGFTSTRAAFPPERRRALALALALIALLGALGGARVAQAAQDPREPVIRIVFREERVLVLVEPVHPKVRVTLTIEQFKQGRYVRIARHSLRYSASAKAYVGPRLSQFPKARLRFTARFPRLVVTVPAPADQRR